MAIEVEVTTHGQPVCRCGALQARTVTITADRVAIGLEPVPDQSIVRRYRLNAALLFLAVLLAGVWFYRHLDDFITEVLVVGLPAIWAAWQLAFSFIDKDIDPAKEAFRKRRLSQRSTTWHLGFFIVVAAVVLVFTSSLFIKLTPGGVDRVTIEVLEKGKSFTDPIELTAATRIDGRLFFPRLGSHSLELRSTRPAGYVLKNPEPIRFSRWSAVHLKFPDDFVRRRHLLRIVPGPSLRDEGISPEGPSNLVLTVRPTHGPAMRIKSYRYRTVWLGINDTKELREAVKDFNDAEFGAELQTWLATHGYEEPDRSRYVASWRFYITRGTMQDFREERVCLTLSGKDMTSSFTTCVDVKGDVTTFVLEKP